MKSCLRAHESPGVLPWLCTPWGLTSFYASRRQQFYYPGRWRPTTLLTKVLSIWSTVSPLWALQPPWSSSVCTCTACPAPWPGGSTNLLSYFSYCTLVGSSKPLATLLFLSLLVTFPSHLFTLKFLGNKRGWHLTFYFYIMSFPSLLASWPSLNDGGSLSERAWGKDEGREGSWISLNFCLQESSPPLFLVQQRGGCSL